MNARDTKHLPLIIQYLGTNDGHSECDLVELTNVTWSLDETTFNCLLWSNEGKHDTKTSFGVEKELLKSATTVNTTDTSSIFVVKSDGQRRVLESKHDMTVNTPHIRSLFVIWIYKHMGMLEYIWPKIYLNKNVPHAYYCKHVSRQARKHKVQNPLPNLPVCCALSPLTEIVHYCTWKFKTASG